MRRCVGCGEMFASKGKNYRCNPCRRVYNGSWRARRRAAGLPASGSDTWDESKRSEWKARYYSRTDVRARKVAQMRESTARHPDRAAARRKVRGEIERGRLTRQPCETCGAATTHAHHDDYSRPLAVRWLCRTHHDALHAKQEVTWRRWTHLKCWMFGHQWLFYDKGQKICGRCCVVRWC